MMVLMMCRLSEDMTASFFDFINERHMIYIRSKIDNEPWPWTSDKILQEYKFTNVFRELDTGTIWLRENWIEPFNDHPKLFFNVALYRQFNWWKSMELLRFQIPMYSEMPDLWPAPTRGWDAQVAADLLDDYKLVGNKIFTGAHMVRGPHGIPSSKDRWNSKAQYMLKDVLQAVWDAPEPDWGELTLEEAYNWLLKFKGFGPFTTYEVITDLRHTPYLENATDIMTWANAGPGAIRGINRMMGLPYAKIQGKKRDIDYLEAMRELLRLSEDLTLRYIYLEEHVPELEMRDIEHALCEFDKYERVRCGQGKPRSKYRYKQV